MESEIKVKSVANFIELVKKEFGSLKDPEDDFLLWFRGEDSIELKTPLMPKAYRGIDPAKDQYIFRQATVIEGNLKTIFRRESTPYLIRQGIERTQWNEYFLMQHYGLRTRMLDWTESALLALFFSVSENESIDGRVWILAPYRLNQFTIKLICGLNFSQIYIPDKVQERVSLINDKNLNKDELCRRYLMADFENFKNEELKVYYPLAILPPFLDERMLAQQSCFSIFGNQVNGFLSSKDVSEKFLRSIIIDSSSKKEIKNELKWLGITHKSIYPDLNGVCRAIDEQYKN